MIKPDWQFIKKPLLILIASSLVSALIYGYSDWQEGIVETEFNMVERNHIQARRKSVDADRDRELYERYLEKFMQYSAQGYVGEEQRLNWVEQLQLIDASLGLISLNYDIAPQIDSAPEGINVKSRNISIRQSKMDLKVELLHEGDFFKLLVALREQARGFYVLPTCELTSKMNRNSPRFSPSSGNVAASCQLDWYTVSVKG